MNEPRRLYVFCEGQTEQAFCQQLLQDFLFPNYDGIVMPILIAHSRKRRVVHRGGVNKYQVVKDDMVREFSTHRDRKVLFTSFIDIYALPTDFPGFATAQRNPNHPRPYVETLEAAFEADVSESRFVPHLQMHEFETLLFADPSVLGRAFENSEAAIETLQAVADKFGDIEKINDSKVTAPSKRIIEVIPAYERRKKTAGPRTAGLIGMPKLLEKCSHFADWIRTLQNRLAANL